ncbi:MAG TPA: carbonic anhydrase [Desulfobacteraceae bacterium]|nr:carbonic anhydrase [Desulfobacteraceae bacterium]
MNRISGALVLCCLILACSAFQTGARNTAVQKPSPDEAIMILKEGNQRFVNGNAAHPNTDSARLIQAGRENQGDHAYATILSCSDSRVPVERIFDAGIMDLFIIRVAGNVVDVDEAGSIEYGLAHVNTPVLVVLGHTQCGAVTAVTDAVQGHGHPLEINIPPLVDNIQPAVERAMAALPGAETGEIIARGIEENIWQAIEDLFMRSPASRELVQSGRAKVIGAVYDVSTGTVAWLPQEKTDEILARVEQDPRREMKAVAGDGKQHPAH